MTDCAQARMLARWQAPDRSVMSRQNAALLDAATVLVNESARETARMLIETFTENAVVSTGIIELLGEGRKQAAMDLLRRARNSP